MPFKSQMFRLFWCKPCADSCYDYDDLLKSARSRTEDVIDIAKAGKLSDKDLDIEGMEHILECSPHRYPPPPSPSLSADSTDTPLQSPMSSPMFDVATEIENVSDESTMNEFTISNQVNQNNEGKKVNPMIPMKSYQSDDQMYCAGSVTAGSVSVSGHDHEVEFTLCDMVDQLCSLTSLPSCDFKSCHFPQRDEMEEIDLNDHKTSEGTPAALYGTHRTRQCDHELGYEDVTVCFCDDDAVSGMEEQINCIPNEKRLQVGRHSIFWLMR